MFLLNQNNIEDLNKYLQQKGWLPQNETVLSVSKPGEGNMNCVLRITTAHSSYIIKQSRDYVEKYPSVAAPKERANSEAAFYNCIKQQLILQQHMPQLLQVDEVNNILLLQDLGNTKDFSFLYENTQNLSQAEVLELTNFLNVLHGSVVKNNNPLLKNVEMKKLNHQYIFINPFVKDNGIDLNAITDGLQTASLIYKNDTHLKNIAKLLGEKYLEEGDHLLHGDYYPGSWLQSSGGLKIIDPEFCFFGFPEFDLAVLIAHCYLSQQPQQIIDTIINSYKKNSNFSTQLLNQFTGIEIMRRILGLAQLPLTATLVKKEKLLQQAYQLIIL